MIKVQSVGLTVFAGLVAVACAIILTFSLIGREVTAEMMFGTLAGLVVLFGMSILHKLEKKSSRRKIQAPILLKANPASIGVTVEDIKRTSKRRWQ